MVKVKSRSNEDVREREYDADGGDYPKIIRIYKDLTLVEVDLREVKKRGATDNRKGAYDATEEYLSKEKLRRSYGVHLHLKRKLAVTGYVGSAEGVGKNTEDKNYGKSESKAHVKADSVFDKRLKESVAGINHYGHRCRDSEVREQVSGLAEYGDEFLTDKGRELCCSEESSVLYDNLLLAFVLVKSDVIKSLRYEVNHEYRYNRKRDGDTESDIKELSYRYVSKAVCGIGYVDKVLKSGDERVVEQELDRSRLEKVLDYLKNLSIYKECSDNSRCEEQEHYQVSLAHELYDLDVGHEKQAGDQEGYHGKKKPDSRRVEPENRLRLKGEPEYRIDGNDEDKRGYVVREEKRRKLRKENGLLLQGHSQEEHLILLTSEGGSHFLKHHRAERNDDNRVNNVQKLYGSGGRIAYDHTESAVIELNGQIALNYRGKKIDEYA